MKLLFLFFVFLGSVCSAAIQKEFVEACGYRPLADVKQMLENNPNLDVNGYDDGERTPLFAACGGSNLEVATFLLGHPKVDINRSCGQGQTALWAACMGGRIEVVKLLLGKDADVHKCDDQDWTPLWATCFQGDLASAELLLEKGADPNKAPLTEKNPLSRAVSTADLGMVRLLIKYGARIDEKQLSVWVSHWCIFPQKQAKVERALQLAQNSHTSLGKLGFEFLA